MRPAAAPSSLPDLWPSRAVPGCGYFAHSRLAARRICVAANSTLLSSVTTRRTACGSRRRRIDGTGAATRLSRPPPASRSPCHVRCLLFDLLLDTLLDRLKLPRLIRPAVVSHVHLHSSRPPRTHSPACRPPCDRNRARKQSCCRGQRVDHRWDVGQRIPDAEQVGRRALRHQNCAICSAVFGFVMFISMFAVPSLCRPHAPRCALAVRALCQPGSAILGRR
jgi:hypothetical protein